MRSMFEKLEKKKNKQIIPNLKNPQEIIAIYP